VVEAGNITNAAEELHVAHTALGLQIRNLERELDSELFTRHSRGMTITEAGRVLYDHAVEILALAAEARREVRSHGKGGSRSQPITLGITPSISNLIGPDIVVAARELLCGTPLKIVEELSFVLLDALSRGELDAALAYEVPPRRGVHRTPLMEELLLFVAPPGAVEGDGPVAFKDLAASELALTSSRDMVWNLVRDTAERLALPVNIAFEVQSLQAIKSLIQRGMATSVMPYGVVAAELEEGSVAARAIVRPELVRTLFLARAEEKMPFPEEERFLHFMTEIMGLLQRSIGRHGRVIKPLIEDPAPD